MVERIVVLGRVDGGGKGDALVGMMSGVVIEVVDVVERVVGVGDVENEGKEDYDVGDGGGRSRGDGGGRSGWPKFGRRS